MLVLRYQTVIALLCSCEIGAKQFVDVSCHWFLFVIWLTGGLLPSGSCLFLTCHSVPVITLHVSSVVFLRGINVGGANLCKPAQLAKQLKKFDVVNIGAVGTFVVRKKVADSTLRKKIAAHLKKDFGVKCEIMIVPAKAIVDLVKRDPFDGQPSGPDITRFASVLHKRPRNLPDVPL